ncbi:PAT1 [Sanghuangporus sanghuang]
MSFFGVESSNPIEDEKRRFLAGESTADEDIAVYNWGQEDYDGLGNALQEGGDELNDETFGSTGPVGKDFDFTAQALPELERRPKQGNVTTSSSSAHELQPQPQLHFQPQAQAQMQLTSEAPKSAQQARPTLASRESLWDDKSPFSVFRTSSSIGRKAGAGLTHQASSSVSSATRPSATNVLSQQSHSLARTQQSLTSISHAPQQAQTPSDGVVPGSRTLAEIEAEMRAQAQRARELKMQEQQQQLLLQQQQQQLQQQQLQQQQLLQQQHQHQLKPPRMRSQSPSVHRNAPINSPQAGYQVPPFALENYRQQQQQQQGILQDFNGMRVQEIQRSHPKDLAYGGMESQNRTRTPVDPIEFMLQKTAERERGLPQSLSHSRVPSQQLQLQQQQRLDNFDVQEQERRLRLGLSQGNVDEAQVNLRRQIAADQQRQAQLAAAGILDQRRDSPLDQLHHQYRLAMANELASKARGNEALANVFGGTNPAEMTQMQLQMQQRLLAQLAQQEFSQNLSGVNGINGQDGGSTVSEAQREQLRQEAMRKIMEAERQEGKRRRKAQKIAHMSRYNDLMTQSDKDFITRIQVSQLVTSDPYTEDFYAQVYGSLMRSRMGINASEERVLKFGSGEGVALGVAQRPGTRRQNAMQRMEAQVERIVSNARQREKEKGLHAIHSLQGALGKTAGRSYKAAPRQLLQVDTNGTTDAHGHISKEDVKRDAAGAAKEAAKRGREAFGFYADPAGTTRKEPLTHRECLIILESLYDSQLRIEQLRREQPPAEDDAHTAEWEVIYKAETARQWNDLRVMVPIETSDPHPFISLLMPAKGKKLLPRLTRHLSTQQLLQVICLLVACFSQLDVVKNAAILDQQEDTPERKEVDKQTQLFLSTVLQSILPVIAKFNLGVVFGMMGLLMEHCDMRLVIHSRPGQSLLTAFLSRAEVIKSEMMAGSIDPSEIPTEEDLRSWQGVIVHLFQFLAPNLLSLFPSSRIALLRSPSTGVLSVEADLLDQPVWKFLATFALHADNDQQQFLVSTLREKILDNIVAVHKGLVDGEAEQNIKITNVNIFLHALGLDSSQITV